jgi:integrase
VRDTMIELGWARSYVNQQLAVLVRMFKWAAIESLISAEVHAALDQVDGLRRGEAAARETAKVTCVSDQTIQAKLPHVSPVVRAMIELHLASGMRPGQLCNLRPGDVGRSDEVWDYRPTKHKTAHHGQNRMVPIGPSKPHCSRTCSDQRTLIVFRPMSRWLGTANNDQQNG